VITIPNERLLSIIDSKTSLTQAFTMADDVLRQAIQGISDLILVPGLINLDFADVKTIMSGMGVAMMGTGVAEGESRAMLAAQKAVSSPLLEDGSVTGARGVIINVTGGPDMSLMEVNEASCVIQEAAHEDANIIFGASWIRISTARSRSPSSRPASTRAPEPSVKTPDRSLRLLGPSCCDSERTQRCAATGRGVDAGAAGRGIGADASGSDGVGANGVDSRGDDADAQLRSAVSRPASADRAEPSAGHGRWQWFVRRAQPEPRLAARRARVPAPAELSDRRVRHPERARMAEPPHTAPHGPHPVH
jgi:hypothetical protein